MNEKNKNFAERMSRFDTSGIRKMFEMSIKLKDPVNFSIGYPYFPVPKKMQEAANQAIIEGYNAYTVTHGNRDLIDLIANHLHITRKVPLETQELIITSGVTGGILLALSALCDEGDELILPDPYFVLYKHLGQFLGAKMVLLDTYPDFRYDANKLTSLITSKTRAILINSPNNPTGNVLTQAEMDVVVEVARQHGIYIITDEIYHPFLYEDNVFLCRYKISLA